MMSVQFRLVYMVIMVATKLKTVVPGFTPTVRFEEGIRMTLDYIMSHEECQKLDEEFDKWCDKIIDTLEKAKADFNK